MLRSTETDHTIVCNEHTKKKTPQRCRPCRRRLEVNAFHFYVFKQTNDNDDENIEIASAWMYTTMSLLSGI